MGWVSVDDRLPEEAQYVEMLWTIPKDAQTHVDEYFESLPNYPMGAEKDRKREFYELRGKPQMVSGNFHLRTNEDNRDYSYYIHHGEIPKFHLDGSGLRVDLFNFVTCWRPAEHLAKGNKKCPRKK